MKKRLAVAGLVLTFCLAASVCRAQMVVHVSLDTSPLVGHPAWPFALDFQLNDGSGTGDANNTATLSNFLFGGGSASGSPSLVGGGAGDLGSTVTLTDSGFLNEFTQSFNAGSTLDFDVSLTTNIDSGGTPDEFSFAILDSSGFEIPTTGLGVVGSDALWIVDINSASPASQVFAGDGSRSPNAGGNGIALAAPVITPQGPAPGVPEPGPIALLGAGAAVLLMGRRRVRAHRSAE